MAHFFISYSHKDDKQVIEIVKLLTDHGFVSWTDRQLPAGERWDELIDLAIDNSLGMILVVSKHSMESEFVLYEWAHAIGAGKTVIPLCIDETRPHSPRLLNERELLPHPKLERIQWIIVQDKLTTWQNELLARLQEIAGVLPEFGSAIQKAIDLFDEPERGLRMSGVYALKANYSDQVLDALLLGSKHGYVDVVRQCVSLFAERTNYEDRRCIEPMFVDIDRSFASEPLIPFVYVPLIRKMAIREAEPYMLEQIQYIAKQANHGYEKPTIKIFFETLDSIISTDGLYQLRLFYEKRDFVPGTAWDELMFELLKKHKRV